MPLPKEPNATEVTEADGGYIAGRVCGAMVEAAIQGKLPTGIADAVSSFVKKNATPWLESVSSAVGATGTTQGSPGCCGNPSEAGVQAVINKWGKGSPVTAREFMEACRRESFPMDLLLAQGIQESNLARANGGNCLSARTKNIYKVGNTTSGGKKYYATFLDGMLAYISLIKRAYVADPNKVTAEELIQRKWTRLDGAGVYCDDPPAPIYAKEMEALINSVRRVLCSACTTKPRVASAPPAGASLSGQFYWPVPGHSQINSAFGVIRSSGRPHSGTDIELDVGTRVVAIRDGVVDSTGPFAGIKAHQGLTGGPFCILIDHGNQIWSYYGHNSKMFVGRGETVRGGQVIALGGSLGFSTGPHLHFGVYVNGKVVNPEKLDYIGR